jgi:crossover junction endodeoxyribonuclease RusA
VSSRSWTVTIPAPAPWLNANQRVDRRRQAGTVRAWRDAAHLLAKAARVPKLYRVALTAELRFGDKRRRDTPNYYPTIKAAIDGLVDAGVLDDDEDSLVVELTIRPGPQLDRKPYGPAGQLLLTVREVR